MHNCMTLNDWSVFVRALSPYLMHACGVHDDIVKLWTPLRKAALYFLDYREGQHHDKLVNKAQDWLARYARLAERMVPRRNLNTNQLHQCVCVPSSNICSPLGPRNLPIRILGRANDASGQACHKVSYHVLTRARGMWGVAAKAMHYHKRSCGAGARCHMVQDRPHEHQVDSCRQLRL
jgi:hypothetical protein